MADLPPLNVSNLPEATLEDSTSSPARGKQMRANLLHKLRAPPLVHTWDFWHDRQDRVTPAPSTSSSTTLPISSRSNSSTKPAYQERLVHLATITDIRAFWSVFNNFDTLSLPLRDSIHLFHTTILPLWEDPRNARGGCWTFRVPKPSAPEFWKQICLLAVGEQLQQAVESQRMEFRDDICGVSLSVRFSSCLISVWNRDAGHEGGVRGVLETVLEGVSGELRPREGTYYYKRHDEHSAFGGKEGKESKEEGKE